MDSTHDHPEPSENEIEKELKQVFEKIPTEIPIFLLPGAEKMTSMLMRPEMRSPISPD
ncbi:MAG: hypothetical protein R2875_09560 [Desulfobacterales bacterium]